MKYHRILDRVTTCVALIAGLVASSAWTIPPLATGATVQPARHSEHANAGRLDLAIGYRPYWLHPSGCYSNPDAQEIWIAYGYYDGDTPVITGWADAGHTAYLCGETYVDGDFSYSADWSQCVSDSGCPCVDGYPCYTWEGSP